MYEFKDDILSSKKLPKEILRIFSISSTETILKKLRDFQLEEIKDFTLSLSDVIIKRNKGINYESKDVPSTITENVKLSLRIRRKMYFK